MSGQTAYIIGATGATGKQLLTTLIASPAFSIIGEFGRRTTPITQIPEAERIKVQQKVVDFDKLEESGLKEGNCDVVYITLGTTRAAAGSDANFEKIDREYVINAARAAKSDDPTRKQRLVYVSAGGANSSSLFLYPRSKGLTEEGLKALGYHDTIIFRPGMLFGAEESQKERGDTRLAEKITVSVTSFASRFHSGIGSEVSTLAKSVCKAGSVGTAGLPASAQATTVAGAVPDSTFTVIANAGINAMADS